MTVTCLARTVGRTPLSRLYTSTPATIEASRFFETLPEAAEAATLLAAGRPSAALSPLRRAADIFGALPDPAYRLAGQRALARLYGALGDTEAELAARMEVRAALGELQLLDGRGDSDGGSGLEVADSIALLRAGRAEEAIAVAGRAVAAASGEDSVPSPALALALCVEAQASAARAEGGGDGASTAAAAAVAAARGCDGALGAELRALGLVTQGEIALLLPRVVIAEGTVVGGRDGHEVVMQEAQKEA